MGIETDRQDAVTKATTAYAKKRADIEGTYNEPALATATGHGATAAVKP